MWDSWAKLFYFTFVWTKFDTSLGFLIYCYIQFKASLNELTKQGARWFLRTNVTNVGPQKSPGSLFSKFIQRCFELYIAIHVFYVHLKYHNPLSYGRGTFSLSPFMYCTIYIPNFTDGWLVDEIQSIQALFVSPRSRQDNCISLLVNQSLIW